MRSGSDFISAGKYEFAVNCRMETILAEVHPNVESIPENSRQSLGRCGSRYTLSKSVALTWDPNPEPNIAGYRARSVRERRLCLECLCLEQNKHYGFRPRRGDQVFLRCDRGSY